MEINLVELDLSSIQQLHGGAVFQQVQKLIKQAVADCENRPSEDRSRKVSLLFTGPCASAFGARS